MVCRWEGGGGGGREKGRKSVQSMGELGKDFCPNFLQSFLERFFSVIKTHQVDFPDLN